MKLHRLAPLLLALVCGSAMAQITVTDPWVRATVAQQKVTGAFMQITAAADARLVEVRSPVSTTVEIHEMVMDQEVMKMRAIPALDLPAGQAVELKPGGYHVMLMGLGAPVKDGDIVPLTLVVESRDGKRAQIEVSATARPLTHAASGGGMNRPGH